MRELQVNKVKLLLYTDIDQMPADRFSKVNKYWMLSDDLGSSFEDIDAIHINRILLCINEPEKLKKVVDSLRVLIHNIINEVNPESLAFASLIHSIDGVPVTDLSEDNLKRVIKYLSEKGLTRDVLKKKSKEVRESIYDELETFYPDIFTNVLSVAFWGRVKARTMKILQGIAEGKDTEKEIEKIDRSFTTFIRPKKLTGKYTDEIRYEHSFEQNCIVLSKFINQPVKTLTVKEYFALIQHYNTEARKNGR